MEQQIKILIVDDRPSNLFALRTVLHEVEAEFVEAAGGNDALREILRHDFALAILDVQMPEMDGYELAQLIRSREKTRRLPIIFLSAVYSDSFHIFKGYHSGAVDFITKPFQPEILTGKVQFFIEIYKQQRRLEQTIRELEQTKQLVLEQNKLLENLACQDPLTGLCNRRQLEKVLKQETDRCRRYGGVLSLIMLDLDYFKNVNDTFGHEFGDHVLKEFASRIRDCIRDTDIAFRFGGEEFIVLLPETDQEGASAAAEKIRLLCMDKLFEDGSHAVRMTVSCGVASCGSHHAEHQGDLICWADQALYHAKESGRNRVAVHSRTPAEQAAC